MKKQIVHRVTTLDYPIVLEQNSLTQFSVVYGNQLKSGLSYREAAHEFGECLMHSAVCAGRIAC